MKKNIFILFVNILASALLSLPILANNIPVPSGDNNYSVYNIPPELLKNANAVVRMDYTYFELKSPAKAIMTRKYAITILNDKADGHAHFQEIYDTQKKISSIKGALYDKKGNKIRKIRKKEIIDIKPDFGSLHDDNRLKAIEIIHNDYPYTIEFEFQIKFSGLLIYPPWSPIPDFNVSVEKSSYKAVIPNAMDFRYKIINFYTEPDFKNEIEEKTKTYEWTIENVEAINDELHNPGSRKIFPYIFLAPNEFEYDGYKGNMQTWKSYGKWIYDLADGREKLEPETVKIVNNLVKGIDNDEEKIKIIYEYLQSKTRYISIQLGIGGLQPFEASEVDKNGYGDCKALSNYTRAMLKAVGVNSYHATIGAGRGNTSIDPSFPFKGYTNHMILCVPLESDTIWLECTSQNQPFGFLGSFTDDRNALLITENGGKIVRTTRYHQADNTQIRKAHINIDTKGNARAHIVTKYRGLKYESVQTQFIRNEKEQKEFLFEILDIPNMEIENFKYSQMKDRIPEAKEEINLEIKNYASVSGKRIFIPLNILNKKKKGLPKIKNRKTDVVINISNISSDEIIYEVPSYYKVEHLPESVNFESDFGSYAATVSKEGNQITYVRTLKFNKNTYPAERYDDLLKFYKKIVRADKMKLVIWGEDRP